MKPAKQGRGLKKHEPARHPELEKALNDPRIVYDTAAGNLVRMASKAFRGIELRRAAAMGGALAPLISWLLSDAPIDRGERILLAELLAGELRPNGRPRINATQAEAYRAVIKQAKARKRELTETGMSPEDAEQAAATEMQQQARGKAVLTIVREMQSNMTKVR